MGIIRAATSSIGGSLGDQWLEIIQSDDMSDTTVMTSGVAVRKNDKRNSNKKGTADVITDGSVIMVGQNQFMILTDGGKIIDFSAEPGYFTVKNASAPSLFQGQFEETVISTFDRLRFGGVTPQMQKVYFINTQEVKNIAFGTSNAINYFDNFYNSELYLRAHGYFSIRIIDPLKFFSEAVPRNLARVDIKDIHQLYLAEFLSALQTAIAKMSIDGIRISHVGAKSQELSQYMSTALDAEWTQRRGMIIESVAIASISYDDQSKKLIDMRNQGAMLNDPSIREGYVQGSFARGMENAGSNPNGAANAFMGMGMGNNAAGGAFGSFSETNRSQAQQNQQNNQQPPQQNQPQQNSWLCSCGTKNTGNFCANCGAKHIANSCPSCSAPLAPGAKFCPNCGEKL